MSLRISSLLTSLVKVSTVGLTTGLGQDPVSIIITMRLEAYSGFLEANPGFQQRDQFEIAIGLDLLALGRTEEAAQHWQWVVDHDHAGSSLDSARDYLAGLRRQGLLDDENE